MKGNGKGNEGGDGARGGHGLSALVSERRARSRLFSSCTIIGAGFFVDALYQVEERPFICNILEVFVINGYWIFSKTLFSASLYVIMCFSLVC